MDPGSPLRDARDDDIKKIAVIPDRPAPGGTDPGLTKRRASIRDRLPAIDVEGLAGQERDVLHHDRGDEARHLPGLAGAAARDRALDEGAEPRVVHVAAVQIGQGEAGGDVDHPDVLPGPLHGQAAGDGADRRLRGAVGGVVFHADLVVVRANVDDHAAAGCQQMRVRGLAGGEHPGRVGAQHGREIGRVEALAAALAMNAGVVDQYGDRAKCLPSPDMVPVTKATWSLRSW